ncbi:microtubule-binding protein TANGLED [Nicotiana tomentosiformis]|uniref:microtubule-binding protein TANGLED n=1 Tax=Nicotiana tomentosiformis TaxID=4098 RepID=UPI00051C1274|nr:microtubule-binding protein TANGLED [Nicotiana tomentosiformis]XP_033509194.1 microtubule-binding protein TANGLED [Nicotiana tomentosiformis]
MVARTPPKLQLHKKMVLPPPLNPILLRETLNKVDKCMARLQELQYTVTGGNKVISGVTLSPRSTRGYLKTSLRCKQESLRIKNATSRKSPPGKLPTNAGEWRRMSLPAMLLGETVAEIKQASQFAREIVEAVGSKGTKPDPKTPLTHWKNQKPSPENSELRSRRKREKQVTLQSMRSESDTPSKQQRAKSRINFKVSPLQKSECEKEDCKYVANRISPRNRPWVKKTVLFPNPLFHSSPTSQQQKLTKTKSPMIVRNRRTPHKFLVKSPLKASTSFLVKNRSPQKLSVSSPTRVTSLSTKLLVKSPPKFQVKIRSPPKFSTSPTRATSLSKRSPKMSTAAKLRRSFSPSRLANKLASSPSKLRSFSPSRLASRLASPLKSKKSVQKIDGMKMMMSGLKQRQRASTTSMQFSVQGM